jgi:hypothetical protein
VIVVRGIPLYWGIERDAVDRRLLTYSYLNEVLPPYRKSSYGIRIRVSHRHWLHVGKYLYDKTPGRYGIPTSANDIARWGRAVPQEINGDDGTAGADEARHVEQ